MPAEFHYEIQCVLTAAATAITSIGFNRLLNKGIQKRVKPVFTRSRDAYLSAPLRKFTDMLFLSEQFLQVMVSFKRDTMPLPSVLNVGATTNRLPPV